MITIGALFLVVHAVEKTHCVDHLCRKAFGVSTTHKYMGMARVYVFSFAVSTFFNNTPLVALLIPPLRDWGRVCDISPSQLLMPMDFAVLLGSMNSMIGTSTNLVVQGLVLADRGFQFPFFAPIGIAVPVGLACLVFMIVSSPYLLPTDKTGLLRVARDHADDLIAEVEVSGDSKYVGQQLRVALGDLGLPSSMVVKIRRRLEKVSPNTSGQRASEGQRSTKVPKTGISDSKYVKAVMKAWGRKGATTVEESEGSRDAGVLDTNRHVDVEEADESAYRDVLNPDARDPIMEGDILFLTCAQEVVVKLAKSLDFQRRGLRILKSNVFDLAGFGSELVEVIVSPTSPFLGKRFSECVGEMSTTYDIGIVAIRSCRGADDSATEVPKPVEETSAPAKLSTGGHSAMKQGGVSTGDVQLVVSTASSTNATADLSGGSFGASESIYRGGSETIQAGDALLGIVKKDDVAALSGNSDFLLLTNVGEVPPPITIVGCLPILFFALLLCLVASDIISMCAAALSLSTILFAGGWVKGTDVVKVVDFRLLFLMGCSISFAKSISTSGLAEDIAGLLNKSDATPTGALFLIYIITLILTEIVSNNAAAALMYPISVAYADKLGVDFKPFALIVMFSASAAFACPIGYQTHLMVWKPGGYSFVDFVKLGLPLDIIYMVGACLITPLIWKF
jgi:di/tricarboxylate transporter